MGPSPPGEWSSDVEKQAANVYDLRRPSRARTVLDMKDRVPASFEPFITFDFEPDSDAMSIVSHDDVRGGGRRVSRVAIDHFDPEGIEHLRSRFSLASEYSINWTDNRPRKKRASGKAGCKQERKRNKKSGISLAKQPSSKQSQVVGHDTRRLPEGSSSELTVIETNDYTDKRLAHFDLEAALRETIRRHGSSVGASSLSGGLGFRDLSVFGADRSLSSGTVYQSTLRSTLNPIEWARQVLRMRDRVSQRIISGFEGVVHPGEMLLVLGCPGSGCSTLLKALANHTKEFDHVLGERRIGSLTPRDIASSYRSYVWYCSESAAHGPELTVQQTIYFAARAQNRGGHPSSDDVGQLTDALAAIFGLRHLKNLLMGDSKISQAERRRVAICEALAARASVCCWDKSSQALDACAALDFIQALRIATDLSSMATIVTLSQGGETLYQLFDKVCVIGEGRMLYYGKADVARQYFTGLGHEPLPRQSTSDFLISVTNPLGRIQNPGRPFPAPRTTEEFSRAFYRSYYGRTNRLEVANYWQRNLHDAGSTVQRTMPTRRAENFKTFRLAISSWKHRLSIAISRKVLDLRHDWISIIVQVLLSAFQGAITGLAYWQTPDSSATFASRDGVIFIIMIFSSLSAMIESLEADQTPLRTVRQYHNDLYRRSAEALASILFDLPVVLLSQLSLSVFIYTLAGFQRRAERFLVFLSLAVLTAMTMKTLFRSVGLLAKTTGYSISGSIVVLHLLFSGFGDTPSSVKRFSAWLSWLDPLRYTFEGHIINEYHGDQVPCAGYALGEGVDDTVSPLAQMCINAAFATRQMELSGDDYFEEAYGYSYANLWTNFIFIAAFAVVFSGFYLILSDWGSPGYARYFIRFERGAKDQQVTVGAADPYRHVRRARLAAGNESDDQYEIPLNDVFAWKNLQYSVSRKNERDLLLDGVSGYVAPRKMCVIVGQHGVGKTTLLKILSGQYEGGDVYGDVHLNGDTLSSGLQAQIGFCQQTDTHYPRQTVREALVFSANLRQPNGIPRNEMEAHVESCLKMCGLESVADALICTLGLGGRRRTSIAIELAAQPRLLFFLDEPTSGLDPQEALSIVALLRDLANHGQAIICSFHRPSSEILSHFDQILVLHKGGRMVYFGDIGNDCEIMVDYFERNGARPCGSTENPIEWMMDAICSDDRAYIPIGWPGKWLRSPEIGMLRRDIDEFQRKSHGSTKSEPHSSMRFGIRWSHQAHALSMRSFRAYWRSPKYLLSKLSINLLSGLFIGFTFFQSDNSLHGLQRKVFSSFMLTIISIPISCQFQSIFIDLRSVFEQQERRSRMYDWTAFLTAHFLVELFWNILSSVLFFLVWYWALGLPTGRAVYSLLVIGFLYPLFYTTQVFAIVAPSSSTKTSSLLLCVLFSFTGIFDGVTHPLNDSRWQQWLYGASPLTYLLEGFIGQALGQQLVECSQTEFLRLVPLSGQTCADYLTAFIEDVGGYLNNPQGFEICEYCPARTTDEYLAARYNIHYSHRWRNVVIVLGASLLNIVLMFTLMYVFRIRRGRLFRLR